MVYSGPICSTSVVTLVPELETVTVTHKFLNEKSFSQGVAAYPVLGVRSLALQKSQLLDECEGSGWETEAETLMVSTCGFSCSSKAIGKG